MTRDPRSELKYLAGQVRAELERERRDGRRFSAEPELVAWARSDPPAPGRRTATSSGDAPPVGRPSGRLTPGTSGTGGGATPPRGKPDVSRSAAPSAGTGGPAATPAAPGSAGVPSTGPGASSRPAAGDAPPRARRAVPPPPADAPAPAEKAARALPPVGLPKNDGRDLQKLAAELAAFSAEAAECMKCGLCKTRTKVVYGSGTARQPLLFVGEAPGFNEDQQGLPFVGRAGKLLTDIIAAAGFERSDVYIANLLKCRPPENRDPLPHEIEACRPWLERQIEIIRPRVICTLGKYSAQLLTGNPKATIGVLRGKVHDYNGIPVVPTYHPAFLLRSPSNKRATWEDVQLVRNIYLSAEGS